MRWQLRQLEARRPLSGASQGLRGARRDVKTRRGNIRAVLIYSKLTTALITNMKHDSTIARGKEDGYLEKKGKETIAHEEDADGVDLISPNVSAKLEVRDLFCKREEKSSAQRPARHVVAVQADPLWTCRTLSPAFLWSVCRRWGEPSLTRRDSGESRRSSVKPFRLTFSITQ